MELYIDITSIVISQNQFSEFMLTFLVATATPSTEESSELRGIK